MVKRISGKEDSTNPQKKSKIVLVIFQSESRTHNKKTNNKNVRMIPVGYATLKDRETIEQGT